MKEKEKSSLVDLGKRLLEASRKGHAEEVSVLMASGAPFTTDWLGTSPLHLAAQHGHAQTAEVLLRAGVSRDARTKVDRTPLHMAAQHGHTHVVELLISSGACANNTDMLNMTPLHWACEHNHVDIVKILLRAGAKIDIKSKFGKTPVDIARAKGYSDVLTALSSDQDQDLTLPKTPKRQVDRNNLSLNSMKKRQRTKKFPMTAGSWTGPEGPTENGKSRRKATTPGTSPKSAVGGGRRVSAPPQFPNAGSPSLRSPTENSIASLVSAAAIVKAKSESEGECQVSTVLSDGKSTSSTTKPQDSSVLDTLATLATATLSHSTSATSTTPPQQVTAMAGRPIGIAPLTLPPTTPTFTTPLTPSSLFPMPSPLAALSALSSLSSPAQTSPLPLSFSMPVMTPQQVATTQLMPLVQTSAPFFSNAAGVSIQQAPSPVTTAGEVHVPISTSAASSGVTIAGADSGAVKSGTFGTPSSHTLNTAAQTMLPQTIMAPFQLPSGSGQSQLQTQLALSQMLAPIQSMQPSVVLELNATTTKDGIAHVKVDQNQAAELLKSQNQSQEVAHTQLQQDGSEAKQDEINGQNIPGTQELFITLQVPAGLQHVQPQLLTDPSFALQQVQLVQQVAAQDSQQQTSAAAQPQQNPVTIVQQHDAGAQTTQEQAAGSTTPQAPIVQLQLPQEQLNLAHLIQNVGHGALPLTFSTLTPQQIQLLANTQLQIGNQMPPLSQNSQQQRQQQQQQQQQQQATGSQQQQQQHQNITQQLLAQSVPQRTLLPQNYVAQLGQNPVQTTVDVQQQQQQSQQQPLIGPQVLLQVQEDLRKMLEHRQAEEEKVRKELEGKVHALQRDSDKYRTELENAQKEAESYRGRLEVERKENSRLHQLYEAAAKQPVASDSTEDRNN